MAKPGAWVWQAPGFGGLGGRGSGVEDVPVCGGQFNGICLVGVDTDGVRPDDDGFTRHRSYRSLLQVSVGALNGLCDPRFGEGPMLRCLMLRPSPNSSVTRSACGTGPATSPCTTWTRPAGCWKCSASTWPHGGAPRTTSRPSTNRYTSLRTPISISLNGSS